MKEEIAAVIRDMFRVGKVVSTDPEKATVKVKFDDVDEFVSGDLQVLNRKTLYDKDYQMPDIGELVACLFLGSGQISGYVLGSVYGGEINPPANSQDKWVKEFKDGTRFEYDRAENILNIEIKGEALIHVEKTQSVKIDDNIYFEAGKDIEANVTDNVTIQIGKDINKTINGNANTHVDQDKNLSVGGSINMEAGVDINANITGDLNVDASIANIKAPEVNLGSAPQFKALHEKCPCPLYGIFHLNPSSQVKVSP